MFLAAGDQEQGWKYVDRFRKCDGMMEGEEVMNEESVRDRREEDVDVLKQEVAEIKKDEMRKTLKWKQTDLRSEQESIERQP